MNPTQVPFPTTQPVLKLSRRAATRSESENSGAPFGSAAPFGSVPSHEVAAELATLQEREANLRAYEQRLRAWQDELDARDARAASVPTTAPFLRTAGAEAGGTEAALGAAWEKFHRARALLEAEQNQMRDERMALREAQVQLSERETALAERETRLKERELLLTIAVGNEAKPVEPQDEAPKPRSAIARLTQAPWAMFKSGS